MIVAVLRRDPLLLLSVAIAVPVIGVDLLDPPANVLPSVVLTAVFVVVQAALSRARALSRAMPLLRFGLCLGFLVAASLAIDTHGGWPLLALTIPVVALAAAFGDESAWVAVGAVAITLVPILTPATAGDVRRRLIALTMASAVTAIGSRRVVASLERSRDRLRRAHTLQRRRARQLAAVETVGEILAREGPTPAAFDAVMGLLVDTFGYRYPSIYVWDGHVLRIGAQRNYATPIEEFPMDLGVIGRVARTLEPAFLPDISMDPDYVAASSTITGEMSVPLVGDGELLGVLNVEMDGPERLDGDDFSTMKIVADRLAVALALGRERQKLTERARLMSELVAFSNSLVSSLDPAAVHEQVAAGASRVISGDMVILVLRDPATQEYRTVQVAGGDPGVLGVRIQPGEGVTGRAILEGALVLEDHLERRAFPVGARQAKVADTLAAMSAPLAGELGVTGALSWFRADLQRPFTAQEREVAALLAGQVGLAIANAELHHATEVAAVTDPLTGLSNRRYFDAAMARAEAARRREAEGARRARSVIVFDLDHFGLVNKRHGHLVGDRILRGFADVVRSRARASDLLARYGGEEFILVLDGATRNEAVRLANEIRELFAGLPFELADGSTLDCTVSAGCAALAPSETEGALLIERADVGLAMAKSSGRNRVVAA
jgi:diguanylate cyclase (GGDEF)-like protein